jgi:hypothetical protein
MVKSMRKTIRYAGLVLMIGGLCIFVHPQHASAATPVNNRGAVLNSPEQCMLTNNLNNCPDTAAIIVAHDDDDIDIEVDVDGDVDIDL